LNLRIKTYTLLLITLIMGSADVRVHAGVKDSTFIPNDSSEIQLREPSAAVQQEVYNDEAWKYITEENKPRNEQSFFDRLFNDFLESLFDDVSAPDWDPNGKPRVSSFDWLTLVFILIGVALIVFFIIKATGAGGGKLFKGKTKRKEKLDASVEDVDIHGIDYDAQISGAKSRGDYRIAVRLWFLRSLKEMADLKLIDWKIDKTNTDYFYELSGSKLQNQFGNVRLIYDYIWYGDFKLNELRYNEAEQELRRFHSSIKEAEVKK
jgi:hypothetical protein